MTALVLVAALVGLAIIAVTVWSIGLIASGPPPEPDPEDIREVDVPYVCTVCGLSLTVSQAQDGEITAPRHCRENMVEA